MIRMTFFSRPRTILAALALALLHALPGQAQPIENPFAMTKQRTWERVVFQVNEDDPKKWNAVLVNIRNIQAELGAQNVSIALVAISYGLGMLTADSLAANGVQDALATGVEFIACGNSMNAQKVTKEDLIEGVTIAKAGYVELMRRQQQGWSYLRP